MGKHYPLGVITICGVFIGGRDILANTMEEMNCRRCRAGLDNAVKCSEFKELQDLAKGHREQARLAQIAKDKEERRVAQRNVERQINMSLKEHLAAELSWQEVRTLAQDAKDLMKLSRAGFTLVQRNSPDAGK